MISDRVRQIVSIVAGAGFVLAAIVVLQYQEAWAPRVEGIADRWSGVTASLNTSIVDTMSKARALLAQF